MENLDAKLKGFAKLDTGEYTTRTAEVEVRNQKLFEIAQSLMPKYGANWHKHSLVGQRVDALARILHYSQLYNKILNVPGVIVEFGVQWGATLTELINLRSIFEPFNVSRVVYGFDTFSGFVSVDDIKDGSLSVAGEYSTPQGYEKILEEILNLHELAAPMSHIKKFGLIKGDASATIDDWLRSNPHAIIAMAIFDMDLYQPTKEVLKKILPRLVKGSLLVFDELNCSHFPGETSALLEVLGLNGLALRRSPLQTYASWVVWGE